MTTLTVRTLYLLSVVGFLPANSHSAIFNCGAGDEACLIASIIQANDTEEPDTIELQEGRYVLSATTFTADNNGPNGLPPIISDISIIGAGQEQTIIERSDDPDEALFRIFYVSESGALTLQNLTVRNGQLVEKNLLGGGPSSGNGGGIHNRGHLVLLQVAVNDNAVRRSYGGGIYSAPSANAVLRDCLIQNNSTTSGGLSYGGGIRNLGKMEIDGCTIRLNKAWLGGGLANGNTMSIVDSVITENTNWLEGQQAGGAGVSNRGEITLDRTIVSNNVANGGGGGIKHEGSSILVTNSTISNNVTHSWRGGGIEVRGQDATIINSTVSGNAATDERWDGEGGGIANTSVLTLINSTVVGNHSGSGAGGVENLRQGTINSRSLNLKNTIILGNTATDPLIADCRDAAPPAPTTALGHNLVGENTGCPSASMGDITLPSEEALTTVLAPLADNGGPTPTHALLPGSPAIDSAEAVCTDLAGVPITQDQRGQPRKLCDIGAFEYQGGSSLIAAAMQIGKGKNAKLNPCAKGSLWVVLLSDVTGEKPFHPATDVDLGTIQLGPASAQPSRHREKDVNADGAMDLLLRFSIPELGVEHGDTQVTMTGTSYDGRTFEATETLATVGCRGNKSH